MNPLPAARDTATRPPTDPGAGHEVAFEAIARHFPSGDGAEHVVLRDVGLTVAGGEVLAW